MPAHFEGSSTAIHIACRSCAASEPVPDDLPGRQPGQDLGPLPGGGAVTVADLVAKGASAVARRSRCSAPARSRSRSGDRGRLLHERQGQDRGRRREHRHRLIAFAQSVRMPWVRSSRNSPHGIHRSNRSVRFRVRHPSRVSCRRTDPPTSAHPAGLPPRPAHGRDQLLTASAAFRTPDLRKKLLFALGIIVLYRLRVPHPDSRSELHGDPEVHEERPNTGFLGLANLFSGGALLQCRSSRSESCPSASIIVQLLTVVIPASRR